MEVETKYMTEEEQLTDIADSIRYVNRSSEKYTVEEMAAEVAELSQLLQISSEIDNAIVRKEDGLYVKDLQTDIDTLNADSETVGSVAYVVAQAIASTEHIIMQESDTIPTIDEARSNVLYLYKVGNIYEIYALITKVDGTKEVSKLGSTEIDLSVYAKKEDLHKVASTGLYTDLDGKPELKTVAVTGSYSDLTDAPALSGTLNLKFNGTDHKFSRTGSDSPTYTIPIPEYLRDLKDYKDFKNETYDQVLRNGIGAKELGNEFLPCGGRNLLNTLDLITKDAPYWDKFKEENIVFEPILLGHTINEVDPSLNLFNFLYIYRSSSDVPSGWTQENDVTFLFPNRVKYTVGQSLYLYTGIKYDYNGYGLYSFVQFEKEDGTPMSIQNIDIEYEEFSAAVDGYIRLGIFFPKNTMPVDFSVYFYPMVAESKCVYEPFYPSNAYAYINTLNSDVSISSIDGNIIKNEVDGLYASVQKATSEEFGIVKPDNTSIKINSNGDLSTVVNVLKTQAEYDALTPEEKKSGTYIILESTDPTPGGGTTVSVDTLITSGVKIATIYINGIPNDIYAPNGGGGGSITLDGVVDSTSSNGVENKAIAKCLTSTIGWYQNIDSKDSIQKQIDDNKVVVDAKLIKGTKIATVSVGDNSTDIYTNSKVLTWSEYQTGLNDGSITTDDGIAYYISDKGVVVNTVAVEQHLDNGTKIATIAIDDSSIDLFAPTQPTTIAELTPDETHRWVSDVEKTRWDNKVDSSIFAAGQEGQFLVSNGDGTVKWLTVPNAMEGRY